MVDILILNHMTSLYQYSRWSEWHQSDFGSMFLLLGCVPSCLVPGPRKQETTVWMSMCIWLPILHLDYYCPPSAITIHAFHSYCIDERVMYFILYCLLIQHLCSSYSRCIVFCMLCINDFILWYNKFAWTIFVIYCTTSQ